LAEMLTDERVEQHIKQAQAVMDASLPRAPTTQGKSWFKALVVVLSAGLTLAFSWISNWNPIVIVLAGLFFTIPVWRVFRS